MSIIRRLILAVVLSAGLAPTYAQAPPPVPALPDAERRTSYSISASTCACAVNFALYGDSTDYQNWVEVFVNGTRVNYNDTTFGWTITVPTQTLATRSRPISDAILTFVNPQTGTVQIVGARRPRRASQYNEGAGVPTRNFNQDLTDIIAQNREVWDKINDVTGRSVRAPPGETLALLPVLASRQNMGACFDSGGNLTSCVAAPSGSFAAGSGITFTGTNPTTISATPPASILNGHLIANATGSTAPPADTAPSTWFDQAYCATIGRLIIRTTGAWTCSPAIAADIRWWGAKCDAIYQSSQNFDFPSTTLTINSGSPNLLSTGSTFTGADVGKSIWVPGAGVAGAGLSTTILAFTDATHVVLAANASTTVTAFTATNAAPFVYGTDDTAAIQAAMAAAPLGGVLDIPGQQTGCLIKQQGANNYALLQDHPFSIRGGGHFSNLMTDPSMPSTVDNLLVQVGGYDWAGTTWSGFSIGASTSFVPPTLLMYKRYGKRGLALVDSASANFINVLVQNVVIGESGNDYSLYIGNPTSSPSQSVSITTSRIFGGIHLANVADSFRIKDNQLLGSSVFGGLMEFVAGSGKFTFSGNNVTWAGGLKIEDGFAPVVRDNYFEELFATSESNNALVDFNGGIGTVSSPSFTGNIVNAGVSSTSTPVRYSNVTGGVFGDNTISTLTNRTGVTSTTLLSCIAPNTWALAGGTHFSTSLANSYAGC